ncbi:guanylate cyclase activator 2B [Dromiciops gliroides]|uniref:guanylate cyclase activator 2B n=1 Tax=Dromiciops gliroides TaxID=33562 RepID=UPI001CC7D5C9|nr:guanylate cyclase activator 2B [Dromiciops gliroides]
MKVLVLSVTVAAMLLMLAQNTQSVLIKYEGFQVKLESVKKLDELLEHPTGFSPKTGAQKDPAIVCSNPALPSDLQPVCKTHQAADIFKALSTIAQDDCEICINVACTGCY